MDSEIEEQLVAKILSGCEEIIVAREVSLGEQLEQQIFGKIEHLQKTLLQSYEDTSSRQLMLLEDKLKSFERLVAAREPTLMVESESSISERFCNLETQVNQLNNRLDYLIGQVTKSLLWVQISTSIVTGLFELLMNKKKKHQE